MWAIGWSVVWSALATLQYATVLTALSFVILTVFCLPLGLGFVGVKIGLFLAGVLAMGYATYLAWPRSPEDIEKERSTGSAKRTRFQRIAYGLPPLSLTDKRPENSVPDWVQLYVGSVTLFGSSYVMEAVFGIVA